ncbi:MAG: alpha/beta hydrolase [Desulfotignum sp.]|nr:alpha/beta hydrolase [Desulfotignum sp.]
MPIDPQARKILDESISLPALENLSVDAARKRCRDAFCAKEILEHVNNVENRILSLTVDQSIYNIPVRIYTPDAKEPLPVLVYFHGGGFVVNNLDTHDAICRHLANTADCIVVSVDYARSPEYRYPVALKQCYRVTAWVAENARVLGGDPSRIAVGGDSSGGTLAAGVSLMGRDLGTPHICFQLLLYPALDYYLPGTDSYEKFSTGYALTRQTMRWFFSLYLPANFNRDDPYLFPVRAQSHDNLPVTHIITAQYDPLRDEAEQYAGLLEKAGSVVTLKRYSGMIHGFIIMHKAIDIGKKALKEAGIVLKNQFTKENNSNQATKIYRENAYHVY